jgi:hypothetical protein
MNDLETALTAEISRRIEDAVKDLDGGLTKPEVATIAIISALSESCDVLENEIFLNNQAIRAEYIRICRKVVGQLLNGTVDCGRS